MADGTSDYLTVVCACGKRMKAPPTAVGKRAKCTGCGTILTIEAPPLPDEGDLDFGAIDELAAQESRAASRQDSTSSASMRCPSCSSSMTPGAAICVQCGYDMRTKSKVKAKPSAVAADEPAPKKGKSPRPSRETSETSGGMKGNFFLGVAFGTAGAIAAASICYFVWLKAAGVPFTGWMVLLIGAGAGYGVAEGYKAGTHFAGATAAAITLVVSLVTKFVVLAAIVAPVVEKSVADATHLNRDQRVLQTLYDKELKSQFTSAGKANYAQSARARRAAEQRLRDMPEDEYLAAVKQADEDEEKDALVARLTDDELKSHSDTARGASLEQYKAARDNAQKRVDAMPASERTALLAAANKQSEAEFEQMRAKIKERRAAAATAEAAAKEKETLDPDSSRGARLVGYAMVMVVIVFLWTLFPSFVAMSIAWKIAADA